MNLDSLRAYCLSFPHAAEKVQWEDHLLFTIGGKMFVITSLEPAPYVATLKPDPEHRLELLETEGIEPAAYLAKAGWISIREWDTLRDPEWRDLVAESYRMIVSKLPKKLQASISGETAGGTKSKRESGRRPVIASKGRKTAAAKKRSSPASGRVAAKSSAKPRQRAAKAGSRSR